MIYSNELIIKIPLQWNSDVPKMEDMRGTFIHEEPVVAVITTTSGRYYAARSTLANCMQVSVNKRELKSRAQQTWQFQQNIVNTFKQVKLMSWNST